MSNNYELAAEYKRSSTRRMINGLVKKYVGERYSDQEHVDIVKSIMASLTSMYEDAHRSMVVAARYMPEIIGRIRCELPKVFVVYCESMIKRAVHTLTDAEIVHSYWMHDGALFKADFENDSAMSTYGGDCDLYPSDFEGNDMGLSIKGSVELNRMTLFVQMHRLIKSIAKGCVALSHELRVVEGVDVTDGQSDGPNKFKKFFE